MGNLELPVIVQPVVHVFGLWEEEPTQGTGRTWPLTQS